MLNETPSPKTLLKPQDAVERALQRERLARQRAEFLLEEKSRELYLAHELLNKMSQVGAEIDSFESALQMCLEMVCQTIGWPVGHVYLPDPDMSDRLLPANIWYLKNPLQFQHFYQITMDTPLMMGKGLPGRVAWSREHEWIEDVTQDNNFPRAVGHPELEVHGAFAFPIQFDQKIVAILEFFTPKPLEPNPKLIDTMRTIGEQLNRVLERQQSRKELKQMNEALEIKVLERTRQFEQLNQQLQQELKERKELEKQLIQSEKMASLGQLAAGIAHEINNPIGFVTSNIATLEDYIQTFIKILNAYTGAQDALLLEENYGTVQTMFDQAEKLKNQEDLSYILGDVHSLLSESTEGLNRVKDIVKNLKSFARLDESEEQDANLNDCIDSALKIVWNELKYKAQINQNFGKLPSIRCHPGQLNQVFVNLLVNAVQAIPEHGHIFIKTWADDTWIFVEIADTGTGIPEADLPQIFNPFYTTKPVGKGTGLGLSIVYGIIQKHHGTIDVKSHIGKGTTFTLQIPKTGVSSP